MVRFCCRLDKNPDGILDIRQLDMFSDMTDVSAKIEFGTVAISL